MSAHPLPCRLNYDTDGKSVWVHAGGHCVARYSPMGWEIRPSIEEPSAYEFGKGGSGSWLRFQEALKRATRTQVPQWLTPVSAAAELGLPEGYQGQRDASEYQEEDLFLVSVGSLAANHSPFNHDIWGRGEVTEARIRALVQASELEPNFVEMSERDALPEEWDARRIAYFVHHPPADPISVEIVDPDSGAFIVQDGFHRLGAAIFRKDELIRIALGGYCDADVRLKAFPCLQSAA